MKRLITIMILLLSTIAGASAALSDNVLANYHFNEGSGSTIHDSLNVKNVSVSVSTWGTGKLSGAWNPQASGDTRMNTGVNFNGQTTSTICLWINHTSAPPQYEYLFSNTVNSNPSANGDFRAYYDTTGMVWDIYSNSRPMPNDGNAISTNVWYNYCIIRTSSQMRIYRNGVSILNQSLTSYAHPNTNLIMYGNDGTNNNQRQALNDELTIWNREITDAEIIAYYNAGEGTAYPFSSGTTNMTISVNDTRSNTLVSGFSWNYTTTNASDTGTKNGYCSGTSCSITNMTGTLNVTVFNVSRGDYNNPYDSPKNSYVYNSSQSSYTFQAYNNTYRATLYIDAYYNDGTVSQSFNLGTLNYNASYPVGFTITKTNFSEKRTIVTFNGSTLYDNAATYSGGGYTFRQNATCANPSQTCINTMQWGGAGFNNASGNPSSANSTINGTIDEIISAEMVTGRVDKFSPAFLNAWGITPSMTFSSTYVANLYIPTVTLNINPPFPTITDNTNATITFNDADFENASSVVMQWHVNGSLIRTSNFTPTNGSVAFSDVLNKGNYTKGSTLNVTVWATDGYYTTANNSLQVTIGGIRPNPISNLNCGALNKTSVQCNWTNPATFANTTIYENGSIITVVGNTTTTYTINSLSPDKTYNYSFITQSSDGTYGNTTSTVASTLHNYAPNITNYTPSNTTPTYDEGTNQTFSVTASDDDSNPLIQWFKDNILQTIGNAWTWVIGKNEQGNHVVTANVTDVYNATTSESWNVTVLDTYPAPNPPVFTPNGGRFRTYLPVKCMSTNSYSAVDHYDIRLSVNGGSYQDVSLGNKMGFLQFDITQYNYGTTFNFNCTAVGDSGNASSTSATFTRDYINEFYATTTQNSLDFSSKTPYTFGLYYDIQNPNKNITVEYAYADCNGDGQYDYIYNFTSENPSRIKKRFICVFPQGQDNFEIGVYLEKTSSDSWAGSGCSTDYDYSNTCLVKKQYHLTVN